MNDPEIRDLLYPLLTGGVHVDELPVGSTRADVTHLTADFMHGYELKGDGDTLKRVPDQLRSYARAFDYVTFVVTKKHLAKIFPLLPEWVGIMVVEPGALRHYRRPTRNWDLCKRQMLGLLWQTEVKEFLAARGHKGLSKYRTWQLFEVANEDDSIPAADVAAFVRQRLIDRMPQRMEQRANLKALRQRNETNKQAAVIAFAELGWGSDWCQLNQSA